MTWRYKSVTIHGHHLADTQGHVLVHVWVAETALGHPLPPKAVVHHVDENPSNNVNKNLVICQDKAYHKLLHVRARIIRAGGNPNTEKICCRCRTVKSLDAFNVMRRHKSNGRQNQCRDCSRESFSEWQKGKQAAA